MTHRPLHRHPSLWLGLFVLGFLAWAWRDSYRIGSVGQITWSTGWLTLGNSEGEAFVLYQRHTGMPLSLHGIQLPHDIVREFRSEEWSWGSPLGRIPNAVVFFSFAASWAAWLGWCRRRQRKGGEVPGGR